LAGQLQWPGLQQVCRLERTTTRKGKTTVEVVHAITTLSSAKAAAAEILPYWRGHWGIENRLHWVRDAVLREDNCGANLGHSPQNLAACRNVGLSILRLSGAKAILSTLRCFASRPLEMLKFLGIMNN
jgi:predicted transposase YbfD/YdcC